MVAHVNHYWETINTLLHDNNVCCVPNVMNRLIRNQTNIIVIPVQVMQTERVGKN